jgi:tetratricopeptide (TPR) repeat protein
MRVYVRAICGGALFPFLCLQHPARAQDVRVSERLEVLEARVAQDSNDPVAYFDVAMGYWSKHQYDRADSALSQAIALDPEFAVAHLAIALVQLRNSSHWNRLKHAGDTALVAEIRLRERHYRRAFMIDPFLDVRALGLMENYETAYGRLSLVLQLLQNQFRKPYDSMPQSLVWLHSLAAARSNHLPEAITDVQLLGRLSRDREQWDSVSSAPLQTNEYLYMLAALLQRAGFRDDAINLYHQVITTDLGNYEAHAQLARIYEATGDWPRAIAERRAAVDVFPENPCLLLDLGVTEGKAGQFAVAETTLRQAMEAGPRDPRAPYWLGFVEEKLDKKPEAVRAFQTFLQLAPSRLTTMIATARRKLADLQ